jgi:hypothetical protein
MFSVGNKVIWHPAGTSIESEREATVTRVFDAKPGFPQMYAVRLTDAMPEDGDWLVDESEISAIGDIKMATTTTPTWLSDVEAFFSDAEAELSQILNVVEPELPAIEAFISAIAAILSSFFPGTGIAAYLADAEQWITEVASFIQTVDGVVMSPAEAAKIGVQVSKTPLSGDDKRAFVADELHKLYPTLPSHVHNLAIEGSVAKMKGPKK